MSNYNQARRDGSVNSLTTNDFDNLAEVLRLWDPSAAVPRNGNFEIGILGQSNAIYHFIEDGRQVVSPGTRSDDRGHREIIRFDEKDEDRAQPTPCDDTEKSGQDKKSAVRTDADACVKSELEKQREHYVFQRMQRLGTTWYKFRGVFKIDVDETEAVRAAGEKICIYRKVSDVIACPKCDVAFREFSDDEFRSYEGRVLTANYLDEIPCEFAGQKLRKDFIKVFPGQKFRVQKVVTEAEIAVCETSDSSLLQQTRGTGLIRFSIPKRDIDLGYFSVS